MQARNQERTAHPVSAALYIVLAVCIATALLSQDAMAAKKTKRNKDTVVVSMRQLEEEASEIAGENEAPAVEPIEVEESSSSSGASSDARAAEYFSVYRIGPGDILSFRSFDDPTLNSDITVRHDGFVSLPWVEDVPIVGKTREEATALLREAYDQLYVDAEVSLAITTAISRIFTVLGDVSRPGEYPYTRPISVLDALTAAGGLRLNQRGGDTFVGGQGQLVKAFVIRRLENERIVEEYDLRDLQEEGEHQGDKPIYPGDTIYVPEGINLVYLLGEVRQPDVFALSPGMTLVQLLANAGGFLEATARLKQVVLIRQEDTDDRRITLYNIKDILKTGEDPLLSPGDIIYIPRKRLVNAGEFVKNATGVITPILGLASQSFGLYTGAFDAFHRKEQFDRGGFFGGALDITTNPVKTSLIPQFVLDSAASVSGPPSQTSTR